MIPSAYLRGAETGILSSHFLLVERLIVKHGHSHSGDVKIEVQLPTQDIEKLVDHITASTITVIGFYIAADTLRSLIKSSVK
jgi:hypothetical protein